jgi:Domain of unknown function (DUF5666)
MLNTPFLSWRRALAAGVTACSLIVLAACGGGGDDGGSSGNPPVAGASNYTQGPITGFGSVFVGGVRFDDSSASVVDEDGNSVSRSLLKLGVTVEVDSGSISVGSSSALALRIRLGNEVKGPVSDIDTAASTVKVLGQTVLITTSTLFDETLMGGLSALRDGQIIEVYGINDPANKRVVATRIEAEDGANFYKLRGQIVNLDTTAKTFTINDVVFNYASLPAGSVPPGLVNGQYVRVLVQTTQVNGQWVVAQIRGGLRVPDARMNSKVEGIITSFTSTSTFQVNGLAVDASAASFPDGTAGIVLGARVEVYGTVENGVIVASKVEIEERNWQGPREWELRGELGNLNTTDKTFALRGVTVWYGASGVEFKDGTEASLANGKRVEVKGVLSTDRVRLEARRIEFK